VVGEVIKETKADIVLLQEVDFDSRRSGNIDQLKVLANITGLRYGAYALNWKAGYVPYPYWHPNRHFGKINSGGAVLSRHLIKINRVTVHPKPESNSWIYNAFYNFRLSQYVEIDFGEKTFAIINNHLEAFNIKNREEQASAMLWMVNELKNTLGMNKLTSHSRLMSRTGGLTISL
jgi:endonuclease/exonuclease/phosphatase family metal-dependent hydrolase